MVGSVNSNSVAMMQMQQMNSNQKQNATLTDSQLETISSVLSEYDSENLTQTDAQEIIAAFEEAGIQPSQAMEEAMAAEGFTASEIGPLAGMQPPGGAGNMPPPPPPSEEEVSDISTLLDSLLGSGEEDDDTTSTSSFDDIMNYTSRILNLNDSSKSEVMEMLDNYAANENDYSPEQITSLVKNSLSSILSDENNYNRVSLYA